MLEGLLYAGLVDIAVHGCFKRGAVGCSHVQARGAPARSPHRLWCLDSRQVGHGAHSQQHILPGVPAAAMGAVLVGVGGLLLCSPPLCVVLVRGRDAGADTESLQVQGEKRHICLEWQTRVELLWRYVLQTRAGYVLDCAVLSPNTTATARHQPCRSLSLFQAHIGVTV